MIKYITIIIIIMKMIMTKKTIAMMMTMMMMTTTRGLRFRRLYYILGTARILQWLSKLGSNLNTKRAQMLIIIIYEKKTFIFP